MSDITINIELFGFLQDCSNQKIISITTASGSTIAEIKQKLMAHFKGLSSDKRLKEMPDNCVLSNEEEILFDEMVIEKNSNLVILPPVCGG